MNDFEAAAQPWLNTAGATIQDDLRDIAGYIAKGAERPEDANIRARCVYTAQRLERLAAEIEEHDPGSGR